MVPHLEVIVLEFLNHYFSKISISSFLSQILGQNFLFISIFIEEVSEQVVIVGRLNQTQFDVAWTVSIELEAKGVLTDPAGRISSRVSLRKGQITAFPFDMGHTLSTLISTIPFSTLSATGP